MSEWNGASSKRNFRMFYFVKHGQRDYSQESKIIVYTDPFSNVLPQKRIVMDLRWNFSLKVDVVHIDSLRHFGLDH